MTVFICLKDLLRETRFMNTEIYDVVVTTSYDKNYRKRAEKCEQMAVLQIKISDSCNPVKTVYVLFNKRDLLA